MATKAENRDNPDSCWNKALDDEPIFVLRANDPLAPHIVEQWAILARVDLVRQEKPGEAEHVAAAMRQWRAARRRGDA